MKRASGIAEIFAALAVGLLFGVGLIVSGMVNAAKVLGFLDLAGAWDPSLALVMAGAVAVGLAGFALAGRRVESALGLPMHLPASRAVDRRLLGGSFVFGIGWGLAGLCPGPAVVAFATGSAKAMLFTAAMLAAMVLFEWMSAAAREPATRGEDA